MRALSFLLCLLASPAAAQDYVNFHAPSGNIQCAIFTGEYAEFDWGSSFAVDAVSRKGYLACVSDAVANDDGLELGYGKSIALGGFECSSEKSGMTCTNPAGHGFTLSKARQKLF